MANINIPELKIPYIPELDNLSYEEIIHRLDDFGTRKTIDCLNWQEQYPYRPLTSIATAHSGSHIYIDFFVRCNYLRAVNYENNSSVHQDSCVEFFVCPTGELPYYNFEFNCIGTAHVARRIDRHSGELLTDGQIAMVKRYPSCGNKPFNELEGLF